MPVYSFTKDKINDLNESLEKRNKELLVLKDTNAREMYLKELKELKL